MWQCDSVTVWQCDSVTMWQCDCVTVWLCDCVTVWQCDCVTVWQCDCASVWLCDNVTVWQYSSVRVWQCDCVNVCQCDNVTVWEYGSVSVLQCDCVTVCQCDWSLLTSVFHLTDGSQAWNRGRLRGWRHPGHLMCGHLVENKLVCCFISGEMSGIWQENGLFNDFFSKNHKKSWCSQSPHSSTIYAREHL